MPTTILYITVLVLSLMAFILWRLAALAEKRQLWTFRLWLSLWRLYFIIPWSLSIALFFAQIIHTVTFEHLDRHAFSFTISLVFGLAILVGVIELALHMRQNYHYLQLRWKAWTGPSRTGIPGSLVRYIGNANDWLVLSETGSTIKPNPVEKFASLLWPRSGHLQEDPTDLLRDRARLDQRSGNFWSPQSREKAGVYQPTRKEASGSLLWGEHLGFHRRCSRGIISIPPALLKTSPTLASGLKGNAICLAYGILSRNKGLNPTELICNLKVNNTFREFEEASTLMPRSSKTLRSHYYAEFERSFLLLGPSYITAATELALLLEDSPLELTGSWLDLQFEHQDLSFNLKAHAGGASPDDLERLYRGHYASMLVSLSAFHVGCRIRPELTVFDAVCKADNAALPIWASSNEMRIRRQRESAEYGASLAQLVNAIV